VVWHAAPQVYKARLLGVTVAVKQATSRKKTSGEALMREVRYLRLAGAHPNIVTAFGAFAEGGRLHLVLEYARHCLRNDRVARQIDPILTLAGVLRALVRLHSLGIVHRDLKARHHPPLAPRPRPSPGPWPTPTPPPPSGKKRPRRRRRPPALRLSACPQAARATPLPCPPSGENRAMLIDFGLACHVPQDPSDWVGRTVGTKKRRPLPPNAGWARRRWLDPLRL